MTAELLDRLRERLKVTEPKVIEAVERLIAAGSPRRVIVLDASAAVELVLETSAGERVAGRLRGESIHAPAHLDVEVVSAIRRVVIRELISDRDGLVAVDEFRGLAIRRWTIPPFVDRSYELRATHTFADALYVALAEAIDVPLLTTDERLMCSYGHDARIEIP